MVLAVLDASIVIEVAGVGYEVAVTPQHARALRIGTEALLHTALIVREDDLSLCGFATRDELEVFVLLRGVTGVGPKSALGVLAALTPAQIAVAIEGGDDAAFRRVSGIGPKTAKLITISLAGRLEAPRSVAAGSDDPADRARIALEGLGFPKARAQDAVDEAVAAGVEGVQAIVRAALAALGPAGVR